MTRGHLLALLAAVAVVLAGCGGEGSTINDQMRQGDQKGYVAGDGTIQVLAPEERETVITLEGTTLEDEAWSSQDHLGEVVVVNDRFGVRLTDVVSPSERIRRLR